MKTKLTIRDVLLEATEVQKDIDKGRQAIEGIQEDIKSAASSVAEHLMITAKPFKTDFEAFNSACKAEMTWLKSDEAGKAKVDKIPRSFIQAKSDIIGAMKEGIDPSKTKSYHDLKEQKIEARKGSQSPEDKAVFDVSGDLGQAVQSLVHALKDVPAEKEKQVVSILESATLDISVLLELRPQETGEQPQVATH